MHALPEAMVSEAEMSLESALSKGALIQRIPDLHGTEHLRQRIERLLRMWRRSPDTRDNPAGPCLIGSDRIALHIRPGVKRCILGRSASLEPGVVVGQAITCVNQSIGSCLTSYARAAVWDSARKVERKMR